MKKVAEIFGFPKVNGNLGVEIEMEGKRLRALLPSVNCPWKTEDDGSLRGRFPDEAAEFVFSRPLPLQEAIGAIRMLADQQRDAGVVFSFRTSVHVHVNVTDMAGPQALAMIYVSLLLEELLMKFCGEERVGNRFCLRIQDAEGMIDNLTHVFEGGVREIQEIPAELIRYSAINIASIPKYGSVEFRGMRGNLDINVLTTWLTALDNIRKYALTKVSPLDVYEEYAVTNYEDFAKKVLGNVYKEFLYEGYEGDIARSFSLTLDLPNYYNMSKKREGDEKLKYVEDEPINLDIHPVVDADGREALINRFNAVVAAQHQRPAALNPQPVIPPAPRRRPINPNRI